MNSSEAPITVYLDYMSQPSRAVLALLKFNNIPHRVVAIRVQKGEHLTPEYQKVNPLQKVPAIDDSGFVLAESHAILRYLCNTRPVKENWYPNDAKKRAMIDRYLEWHHLNTRRCGFYLASLFFPVPSLKGSQSDKIEEREKIEKILKDFENIFLGDKNSSLAMRSRLLI